MTITLSLWPLALIAISVVLFIAITWFCVSTDLFNSEGMFNINPVFVLVLYACGWAVPSLGMWAIYATWFR